MKMAAFYFGGYNASWDDVVAWGTSASMQVPNMVVNVYPWPAGAPSWPEDSVVKSAEKLIMKAVADVEKSRADLIYILGHSSGCAIANEVERRLQNVTKRAIIGLVALDGYTPKGSQLGRFTTQVWGAMCDGQPSKNFPDPGVVGRHIYQVPVKNCKKLWPLHFVLVNAAARDGKVTGTSDGYDDCVANLIWMPKLKGLANNAYQITFP